MFDKDTCRPGSIMRSSWHTVRVAQLLRCLQSLRFAPVQLLKGLRANAELLCAWCACYLACARVSRVTRCLDVCNYTLQSPLEIQVVNTCSHPLLCSKQPGGVVSLSWTLLSVSHAREAQPNKSLEDQHSRQLYLIALTKSLLQAGTFVAAVVLRS